MNRAAALWLLAAAAAALASGGVAAAGAPRAPRAQDRAAPGAGGRGAALQVRPRRGRGARLGGGRAGGASGRRGGRARAVKAPARGAPCRAPPPAAAAGPHRSDARPSPSPPLPFNCHLNLQQAPARGGKPWCAGARRHGAPRLGQPPRGCRAMAPGAAAEPASARPAPPPAGSRSCRGGRGPSYTTAFFRMRSASTSSALPRRRWAPVQGRGWGGGGGGGGPVGRHRPCLAAGLRPRRPAALAQMHRSTVVGPDGQSVQDDYRTSYGTFLK
jgi:hypothetical protein